MENKFTPELIEKAKKAKNVEELIALAKENNIEFSDEEANAYFAQLNQKLGELSDDELDNVAGGGCHRRDGSLMITAEYTCIYWACQKCGKTTSHGHDNSIVRFMCKDCKYSKSCSTICTNPLNNCNN